VIIIAAKLGASLAAILALGWAVRAMALGGDPRIEDEEQALRIADEGQFGFVGVDVALDRSGCSALVRNAENAHVLISRKGNQFVTNRLIAPVEGRLDHRFLTIDLQRPDMDPVTLNLGDQAQVWASGLRHVARG
jgi:hypothetical protein